MSAVVKALDGKETTAAVKRLGLTAEASRLRQWVTLYGAKLGLTEARETDPAAVAVEAWHEAYGELTVHVHSEYGSAKGRSADQDPRHAGLAVSGAGGRRAPRGAKARGQAQGGRAGRRRRGDQEVR